MTEPRILLVEDSSPEMWAKLLGTLFGEDSAHYAITHKEGLSSADSMKDSLDLVITGFFDADSMYDPTSRGWFLARDLRESGYKGLTYLWTAAADGLADERIPPECRTHFDGEIPLGDNIFGDLHIITDTVKTLRGEREPHLDTPLEEYRRVLTECLAELEPKLCTEPWSGILEYMSLEAADLIETIRKKAEYTGKE